MLNVDPENQNAVSSLDRLFIRTERWADLAQILAREAEIGQTPDEILEFKYRLGQVHADASRTISTRRSPRTARFWPPRPSTRQTLEALEGSSPRASSRSRSARSSSRSTKRPASGRSSQRVYEAQLAHLTERRAERLAMYYRIAELLEEKLLDAPRRARRLHRARSRSTRPTRSRAKRSSGSPARSTAAGRRSPTRTPTCSGFTTTRPSSASSAGASRAPSRTSSATSPRPKRRTATCSASRRSTPRRSPTSIASTPRSSSGPSSPQMLEQRVKATDRAARARRALRAPRRGLRGDARRQVDDAIRAFRRIFDGLDKTHEGAIQALARIYEQKQAWTELNTRLRARARERHRATSQEAEIRAKIAHLAADRLNDIPTRAIETWKRVLDLRGEDPEALGALANLYERQAAVGASSCDVLERAVRHRRLRRPTASRSCTAARELFIEQLGRDELGARRLQPRPRHRLRERRGAPRDRGDLAPAAGSAASSSPRSTRSSIAPAAMLDGRRAQGDLPRARQDLRRACSASRSTRPTRGASSSRSTRATSRRWTRSRPSTAPRSSGPRSSTSRCSAPRALEDRRARSASTSRSPTIWEQAGPRQGQAARTAYEKILEIDADARRGVPRRSSSSTARRRGGSRSSSSTSRASRRARRRTNKTDILRKIARVFEEKLDDKSAGVRRARQRVRDGLRDIARRPSTSSAWRRPRAAGASSSRPQHLAAGADGAAPEDPPLPAPRQVVRRGPRPPRVRAAVLRADRRSSIRTTSACSGRWRSFYRKNGQLAAAGRRRSRARSTSRSPTSIARRSSPSSASCSSAR